VSGRALNRNELPLGRRGEEIACRHLVAQGYRILVRNYRSRLGEVDIIAEEGATLVFVEVKSRRGHRCGHPSEAVTPAKCRQISRVALLYLAETGRFGEAARFDVVAVTFAGQDGPLVELLRNAFELSYGT
jgi:putative endonuclease